MNASDIGPIGIAVEVLDITDLDAVELFERHGIYLNAQGPSSTFSTFAAGPDGPEVKPYGRHVEPDAEDTWRRSFYR